MEKIEINKFKAFGSRLAFIFTPDKKNLLLYGENGSGKSSVFEAIKLIFYKERLQKNVMSVGATDEQRSAEEEAFYNAYRHKEGSNTPPAIEIKINDVDFKDFNAEDYHCYMLSHIDISYMSYKIEDGKIKTVDIINLKRIVEECFFPNFDIDTFLEENTNCLIESVNNALREDFIEPLQIGLENDKLDIYLNNTSLHIQESDGLSAVFNEARLRLVVVLLLLNIILKLEEKITTSHKIIVLDDIVNSFDSSNRKFITNYLLSKFGCFQKVIFTHNIGFNNIADAIIKNNKIENSKWLTMNLYLTKSGPQLYNYNETKISDDIASQFENGLLQPDVVGNIIRKRFEADLNEFCKIIHAGKRELSRSIIARLYNRGPLYYKMKDRKMLDANNLVQNIDNIIQSGKSDGNKIKAIREEIVGYTNVGEIKLILSVIDEFIELEKLFLHGLSHSSTRGMPEFDQKLMRGSLLLLKKFEECLDGLKGGLTQ